MTSRVRIGVGSRLRHDGEAVEVVEIEGIDAVLKDGRNRVSRVSIVDLLLDAGRTVLVAETPSDGVASAALVVDVDRLEGPIRDAAVLPVNPETLVVGHGKVYVSEHVTSACARLGISIQPARVCTPTDKPDSSPT